MSGRSLRRISGLGRFELLLFWRNRTAMFTALLLPVGTVGFLASIGTATPGELSADAFVLTGLFGFVLLYVVYYNLVSTYVARREELVLKRLRTGEVTDAEIITGTAVPAMFVALAQSVAGVAAGAVLLDLPMPVNPVVLLGALLAGIALFVLLAAGSTVFTKNVEMAQLSTMPLLLVCFLGSGVMFPLDALPDRLAEVLSFLPLTPVLELARLGWLGTDGSSAPTGFVGVFGAALGPFAILVGWTLIGLYAFRRWFRWEPRR
ncbi:ABC transporter permease [Micromonospora sp. NPDC050397]|uniref:ABC transporter permease n=1 Tax=Micromonospora sp. NPDC050397 TaxID=3364279 RepID=UPI00384F63B2